MKTLVYTFPDHDEPAVSIALLPDEVVAISSHEEIILIMTPTPIKDIVERAFAIAEIYGLEEVTYQLKNYQYITGNKAALTALLVLGEE